MRVEAHMVRGTGAEEEEEEEEEKEEEEKDAGKVKETV